MIAHTQPYTHEHADPGFEKRVGANLALDLGDLQLTWVRKLSWRKPTQTIQSSSSKKIGMQISTLIGLVVITLAYAAEGP